MTATSIFLVSACLLGLKTRYDGQCKVSKECLEMTRGSYIVPVCPEQLGGLTTPREAADIVNGDGVDVLEGRAKVINRSGDDVTSHFVQGAYQVLKIADIQNISAVCLKSRSPSCGVKRLGVTGALLKKHGYILHEF